MADPKSSATQIWAERFTEFGRTGMSGWSPTATDLYAPGPPGHALLPGIRLRYDLHSMTIAEWSRVVVQACCHSDTDWLVVPALATLGFSEPSRDCAVQLLREPKHQSETVKGLLKTWENSNVFDRQADAPRVLIVVPGDWDDVDASVATTWKPSRCFAALLVPSRRLNDLKRELAERARFSVVFLEQRHPDMSWLPEHPLQALVDAGKLPADRDLPPVHVVMSRDTARQIHRPEYPFIVEPADLESAVHMAMRSEPAITAAKPKAPHSAGSGGFLDRISSRLSTSVRRP